MYRSVVFRAIVEDNIQIGEGVMIVGPAVEEGEELSFTIPEETVIPDGAISPARRACRRS
ncbi:MAG: hypothetical protein M3122_08815 [Actinomycetota bacterium]|nr:hypothetical protein [Actinomycetota bacterium]